jgi:phosphatidylinositol glycan class M
MQPNIFWFESFGKLLFVLFDLLCGYLIIEINNLKTNASRNLNNNESINKIAISFWFYNPITIAISSRGNAESLMAFLVLTFIFCLKKGYLILAGFFYAFSLHFKIYPVLHLFYKKKNLILFLKTKIFLTKKRLRMV